VATGQDVLDRMKVLFPELQVAAGGADVARALTAVNMAQDYLESVFALHPEIYGDSDGTVTTTQNQETTPFPTGVIRLDQLYLLDPLSGRPTAPISIIRETGAHAGAGFFTLMGATSTAGRPSRAYTNGRKLFWTPYPDSAYTVRWYGLQQQADITLTDPILYADLCLTPLANFAVQVTRIGLDDDTQAYDTLAKTTFEPVVAALTGFRRDRAAPYQYKYSHDT
jgi:hypothetical protein